MSIFWQGALLGFSIAMPVGPIGLLCIRTSLTQGLKYGLMTGLGAASADMVYGLIAGYGVTAISHFLTEYNLWIQVIGALFLCYLGICTFISKVQDKGSSNTPKSFFYTFITTFFLTLTNPMTILSFAGLYAGLGLGRNAAGAHAPLILASGVFAGCSFWWLILSTSTSLFKDKINQTGLRYLNYLSGTTIFGFGISTLLAAF